VVAVSLGRGPSSGQDILPSGAGASLMKKGGGTEYRSEE
jgi:hypothetical protein